MITFKDACKFPDEQHVNMYIQEALQIPSYFSIKNANAMIFGLGPSLIGKCNQLLVKALNIFNPAHILAALYKPVCTNKDTGYNLYWYIICEYKLFYKLLPLYNNKAQLSMYESCIESIGHTIRMVFNLNEVVCNLMGYCPKALIPEKYQTLVYSHILDYLENSYSTEVATSLLEQIDINNGFALFFKVLQKYNVKQKIYEEILSSHLIDDAIEDILECSYSNENACSYISSTFFCGKSIALMDSTLNKLFIKDKPKLYAHVVSQLINEGKV